jgi:MYXO-CTERM domain-containing protein
MSRSLCCANYWKGLTVLAGIGMAIAADAQVFVNQPPRPNGGTFRWSQLWVDPGPNGNDLDSDAICYSGFVLNQQSTIRRIDWWGKGVHELGFDIEFWRQDPGTVAYQPIAVFRDYGAEPTAQYFATSYQTEAVQNFYHHWIDLPTPITLPGNDASNPRWFISIIAKTHQAYYTWDWAQGTTGLGTFYWIRGAHMFFSVGDSRAFMLTGEPVPEPGSWLILAVGLGLARAHRRRRVE